MSVEFDRMVLQAIVKRLEPMVGNATQRDFHLAQDGAEALIKERCASGWLPLAQAYLDACDALASDDPDQIAAAAYLCKELETNGLNMAHNHRADLVAKAAKTRQKNGGRKAGSIAATKSMNGHGGREGYDKYRPMFAAELAAELAKGASERHARKMAKYHVDKQMTKDNFVDPFTGAHPADRTLRKHYYPKK
jgi:hypothetical protein